MSGYKCAIICALPCEATPLISYYKLKLQKAPYTLYTNKEIVLIVSGVGKIKAAAATGYIQSQLTNPGLVLNIGIAGHKSHEIGDSFLAHKITEKCTQKNFYPTLLTKTPCQTCNLLTVDKPDFSYDIQTLYDMEAFGFYTAALMGTTTEFAHCYKIISDNQESQSTKLDKKFVSDLIEAKCDEIEMIKSKLISLLPQQPQNLSEDIQKLCHFTQTEKHKLKRLCQRWQACHPTTPLVDNEIKSLTKAPNILKYIETKTNNLPLRF